MGIRARPREAEEIRRDPIALGKRGETPGDVRFGYVPYTTTLVAGAGNDTVNLPATLGSVSVDGQAGDDRVVIGEGRLKVVEPPNHAAKLAWGSHEAQPR